MVAIESAQFSGTAGNTIPSGSPFALNLTIQNGSVLDQEYNIKVVYSDGDPVSNGTKIASVVVTMPSAAVGGIYRVAIPLNVSAPEGTRLKIYVIAYPRCPAKRMPNLSYDCRSVVYPVGTLTVTHAAGRGGPLGVAYPGRVWTGESLPRSLTMGSPYAVRGTDAPPTCNVVFPRPQSIEEYRELLSMAKQGSSGSSGARGSSGERMVLPQKTEMWSYCPTNVQVTETQDRWMMAIYDAGYQWWVQNKTCACDPPNCFVSAADPSLKTSKRRHTDACGNVIVDEWCPACDPSKCFDQKPTGAKSYVRDSCGKYVVTEWCDPNCPHSPTDKIIQERFPDSKILDFTTDVCNCVVPRVRQLSPSEISALNKTIENVKKEQILIKAGTTQPRAGRIVISKRTVVIPGSSAGVAMAVVQGGVLPIFAPRRDA